MTETLVSDGGFEDDLAAKRAGIVYEIDDEETPSEAVVRAVSALQNTPPLDLDPLYDAIDPDDLDGAVGGAASVAFPYEGCAVTVTGEAVTVEESDEV